MQAGGGAVPGGADAAALVRPTPAAGRGQAATARARERPLGSERRPAATAEQDSTRRHDRRERPREHGGAGEARRGRAQGGGAARSAPRRGRRGRAHRRSPGPQDGATAPGGPRGPPPTRGPTGPGPRGGSMPARVTAGLPSTGRGPQALLDIRTLFRQGGRG